MRILFGALLLAFLLPAAALAQVPSHLDDIAGERARSGERDLRDRGYVHIETHKSGDRSHSYWWNTSRHECIRVTTRNGRYDDIDEASSSDCNQHHSSDEAVGAAVAVGAAALIIGALASSHHKHKSHHHEDNRHHDDDESEREFERGHRDGLHHRSYDNYNDTQAYRRGYDSGAEQRRHDTSHRHHSGRHDTGYSERRHSDRDFERLGGGQASSVDGTLRNWGFQDVDGFASGSTRYVIWYNNATRQCLQMTTADGRAEDVRDIGFHPTCH